MSFSNLLNQTMDVDRLASEVDASGGQTLNYDERVLTGQPCRVNPATQEDRDQFAQIGIIISYAIYSTFRDWVHGDRVTDSLGRVLFVRAFRTHDAIGSLDAYSIAYAEDK